MSKTKWMTILGVIALVSTIYLVISAGSGEELFIDEVLNSLVLAVFSESTHSFFGGITELGDTIGIAIVALITLILLWLMKRDYAGMVILLLSVGVGNEINKWVKDLVGRERPVTAELAESLSFPSGHAMVGFILYVVASYLLINHIHSVKLKWGIGILSLFIILLIGLSRIVLQDHFPTDVLGGFSMGLIWSLLWISLYGVLYKQLEKKSKYHKYIIVDKRPLP
jgi:undecaprenyl-diphosphatase